MKRLFVTLCVVGVLAGGQSRAHDVAESKIQMAILLDTSNSMSGLINQARSQIWSVVNEFAKTEKHGKQPRLEIALYHYGNSSLPISENYIERLSGFTDDLDLISEKLFSLTTRGGSEYCGSVIKTSVADLDWSENDEDYKVVFVAGNEPFTQGPDDYRVACGTAIGRGIIVNTIFCGGWDEGVKTKWADGATLGEGKYLNIDQDARVVRVKAPQDKELIMWNAKLNATYIAYGSNGVRYKQRQEEQDSNARSVNLGSFGKRAASKSQSGYSNGHWDICDHSLAPDFDWSKVKKDDLPENMRKMSDEERKKYVDDMLEERKEVQKKITTLNGARERYVAAERSKAAEDSGSQLDSVVITTVREQVVKKSYTFKSE